MRIKITGWLSIALGVAAGALVLWLWKLSPSYSPTSTLFRRGYFLLAVLLGTASLVRCIRMKASSSTYVNVISLGAAIFMLLIAVAMAYLWISGH